MLISAFFALAVVLIVVVVVIVVLIVGFRFFFAYFFRSSNSLPVSFVVPDSTTKLLELKLPLRNHSFKTPKIPHCP